MVTLQEFLKVKVSNVKIVNLWKICL